MSESRLIKSRLPPYFSKEEAERKTGKFRVVEIEISIRLYNLVRDYIFREGIYTWSLTHGGARTSSTHTCKFKLNYYNGDSRDRAYIKYGGSRGIYSYSLKERRYVVNRGMESETRHTVPPRKEDVDKFKIIEDKTPDINQMYFWIVRKYPNEVKWVNYYL